MPAPNAKAYYAYEKLGMHLKGDWQYGYVHLNTIMFGLVALAGFTGSMVHLATSFTNYVGAGKFKRSWILWYCVKPFTAAAVAVIFYMVLKAGLLSYDGGGGVNPFGIVILAALAGLFTDKATLKLEEIFAIIFKPKDNRPNTLDEQKVQVESYDNKVAVVGSNKLVMRGKGFDGKGLKVMVQGKQVPDVVITTTEIVFLYSLPEELKNEKELTLAVMDGSGNKVFEGKLSVVPAFTDEMRRAMDTRIDAGADDATVMEPATEEENEFVKG